MKFEAIVAGVLLFGAGIADAAGPPAITAQAKFAVKAERTTREPNAREQQQSGQSEQQVAVDDEFVEDPAEDAEFEDIYDGEIYVHADDLFGADGIAKGMTATALAGFQPNQKQREAARTADEEAEEEETEAADEASEPKR